MKKWTEITETPWRKKKSHTTRKHGTKALCTFFQQLLCSLSLLAPLRKQGRSLSLLPPLRPQVLVYHWNYGYKQITYIIGKNNQQGKTVMKTSEWKLPVGVKRAIRLKGFIRTRRTVWIFVIKLSHWHPLVPFVTFGTLHLTTIRRQKLRT